MEKKLEQIFGRRSIRKYSNKEVSDETIKILLKAGMSAPSARATDPWRFIVIKNRGTLKDFAKRMPNASVHATAFFAIVVCGDIRAATLNDISYLLQDCSAAIENILLAAHSLGLGACWCGIHPRENRIAETRDICSLPEHIVPVSSIAIGYPAEEKEARTRYKEEYVAFEKWDKPA